jgi:hypothetical protein
LFIATGVVGGAALLGRIAVSSVVLVYMHEKPNVHEDDPTTPALMLGAGAPPATTGIAIALGLLGGGAGLHGRWQARADLSRGRVDRRRATRRARIGWSLVGAGVGLWGATRLAAEYACNAGPCRYLVSELTYYPSLALATAGMFLGPAATSYRATVRDASGRWAASGAPKASVAPSFNRHSVGVSVSGRF